MQEMLVRPLDWENPLEKEMASQSRILAWEIPWTEEPGGLQPRAGKEPGTAGHGTAQQQSERTAEDFILRRHLSKNPERLLWCSSGCLPTQGMGLYSGWGAKSLCAATTEPA